MKMRITSLALLLAAIVGAAPVYALSLRDLLTNHETDPFKIIQVADLTALMARVNVMIFDANVPDIRASEGVIPGARLLSSPSDYDVATELPAAKTTKLVFYCHNPH